MEHFDIDIRSIPVYQALYGESISSFELARDLRSVPVLEKHHITQGFPNNWITDKVKGALEAGILEFTTTSGTTSDRMQIMRKKSWWLDEYRRTYRYNSRMSSFVVGEDPRALLTTAVCSNTTCFLDHPSYSDRILANTLYLNATPDPNRWTRDDIQRISDEICRYRPIYIDADPVYLAMFLMLRRRYGIDTKLPLPHYMTLSYELATQFCRRYIAQQWSIPTYDLFGGTEFGYLYLEDDSRKLQRCRDLSSVELLPYDPDRGLYYLVVTSLRNEYMPLLRYRTGDMVKVSEPAQVVASHPDHDEIRIDYFCGRVNDGVRGSSGRVVTPGELDRALGPRSESIFLYQVVMLADDHLLFHYMTVDESSLAAAEQEAIRECLVELFGPAIETSFIRERGISPEPSGKFCTLKRGRG